MVTLRCPRLYILLRHGLRTAKACHSYQEAPRIPPSKWSRATAYLSNHDHSSVVWQAGARTNEGSRKWYRTQPHAIALLTGAGTPMIANGLAALDGMRMAAMLIKRDFN